MTEPRDVSTTLSSEDAAGANAYSDPGVSTGQSQIDFVSHLSFSRVFSPNAPKPMLSGASNGISERKLGRVVINLGK